MIKNCPNLGLVLGMVLSLIFMLVLGGDGDGLVVIMHYYFSLDA